MMTAWRTVRADLPKVTQPLLMLPLRRGPRRRPVVRADHRGTVSSRDLTERILENSYHVATLDNDAPTIFEESAAFIRRVTGP